METEKKQILPEGGATGKVRAGLPADKLPYKIVGRAAGNFQGVYFIPTLDEPELVVVEELWSEAYGWIQNFAIALPSEEWRVEKELKRGRKRTWLFSVYNPDGRLVNIFKIIQRREDDLLDLDRGYAMT
jgi:hypothetical protein